MSKDGVRVKSIKGSQAPCSFFKTAARSAKREKPNHTSSRNLIVRAVPAILEKEKARTGIMSFSWSIHKGVVFSTSREGRYRVTSKRNVKTQHSSTVHNTTTNSKRSKENPHFFSAGAIGYNTQTHTSSSTPSRSLSTLSRDVSCADA